MPEFTSGFAILILTAILGYLLGSIPFGVVVTKLMGLGDLRQIGSGNIGATNVLRTGNKPAALATLILDGGKGAAAVLLARAVAGEDAAQMAGLSAFLGHLFPVWLNFKGGKGVATFLGTLLALSFPVGLAACATWLVTAIISRISSLSALVSAALAAIWAGFLGHGEMTILIVLLATLVYWRHLPNIARIRAGTEPRIGAKK
ncbi:MAG: glycerol-3-phosphate 1-O-acyltransferase PlsY [Rhodobacteraceae bacterium]|nr:glycerol-3-phosphate 1-O-acyltransferase PlsY [Paracoccaceae bacterium]